LVPRRGDGLADLEGELELGAGEALGGVLQLQARAGGDERLHVALEAGDAVGRDARNVGAAGVEDVLALLGRGGVVEVEDGVPRARQGRERAGDEVLAALAEDLDGDVGGDAVLVDQPAAEIELDLRGGGEADLDLLEADFHEEVEVLELLLDAHGLGEGLVAVAQVDRAPDRGAGEGAIGPLAVGQRDGGERTVFRDGSRLHGSRRTGKSGGKGPGTPSQRRRKSIRLRTIGR